MFFGACLLLALPFPKAPLYFSPWEKSKSRQLWIIKQQKTEGKNFLGLLLLRAPADAEPFGFRPFKKGFRPFVSRFYTARVTLPLRRQRVQT